MGLIMHRYLRTKVLHKNSELWCREAVIEVVRSKFKFPCWLLGRSLLRLWIRELRLCRRCCGRTLWREARRLSSPDRRHQRGRLPCRRRRRRRWLGRRCCRRPRRSCPPLRRRTPRRSCRWLAW
ncbi:hypothetical protein M758_3G045800 [Ceratodon purpureus]|nr:hypothetical protein M758_3G045800 [Ceratodon purpureus]